MKCPTCQSSVSHTLDTRTSFGEAVTRRKRRCRNGHVFTTYEVDQALFARLTEGSAHGQRRLRTACEVAA